MAHSKLQNMAACCMIMILCGCASVPASYNVPLPANLMQPCKPLQILEGNTGADLTRNIIANSQIYWECADSKQALIDALKDKK